LSIPERNSSVPFEGHTSPLSPQHKRMLMGGSGISPDVIAERGVRTIRHGRELPKEFSRRQRRRGGGILFTVHRPSGATSHVFRPDDPDPENPGCKYELPPKCYGGPGNVLDVHPSCRHLIDRTDVPAVFVEGIRKGDAVVSAARATGVEVLVVVVAGVWNFLADGEPIADMLDIPVEGRRVVIIFDSDMLSNPNVQEAARRLAELLAEWGAEVWISYLRDQADGTKTGADDFFAGGGTFAKLRMLTRRYNLKDFSAVRLSRDERLRLVLEDLERRFWTHGWKGMGGHSSRDVYLKLIEAARHHGTVVDDGIRVTKAQGPLALETKISTRTLWKSLNRLEEDGLIYRDNEGRKPDKCGSFVLRATVSQYGNRRGTQETQPLRARNLYARNLQLRAPRLRWSRPRFTPKRGVVRDTRRVRQSVKLEPRDPIKRLGKIRGAIVDVLDAAGGELELQNLYGRLHPDKSPEDREHWRPRDLVRAKTTAGGRNGLVIMLLQAGIVEWACDVATRQEVLRLTPNWFEALENARELGKEIEQEELDKKRYRTKSQAFHHREEVQPDPHWTNTDADGRIEDLRSADEPEWFEPDPTPLSPLAEAIRHYLEKNPKDADQPAGWLGTTLWAHDLYPEKPTAEEASAAVRELGGDEYRRSVLARIRGAA
jgi:hypothetical protein